MDYKQTTYVVYFVDEEGYPEEWCAESDNIDHAIHYAMVYGQDGPTRLAVKTEEFI